MNKKTLEQISYNMRRVRNKDSVIELLLRKELWKRNLRYRIHVKKIYGNPDIVFANKKIAIFVDSEFWHGNDWENKKKDFKTNREFWIPKIEKNIKRDVEVTKKLQHDGWLVLRFWGKEIKNNVMVCADKIENLVRAISDEDNSL